jgi:Eukaryotic membrane protein family
MRFTDSANQAFADQNLTRRLGLPVIPLSCLFIRASLQTYHMFLATHVPLPIPSTATSLAESSPTSPATTAALLHFDTILRRALGRSSFGTGGTSGPTMIPWSTDDVVALLTMSIFFLGIFLLLLGVKLVLGMLLLGFSRDRYRSMKERERETVDTKSKRVGGWGMVDVDEEKRRWIYKDDPEGLRALREREKAIRENEARVEANFGGVSRYSMVAKRIW